MLSNSQLPTMARAGGKQAWMGEVIKENPPPSESGEFRQCMYIAAPLS